MFVEFVCARCKRTLTRPVEQLAALPQREEGEYPGYFPTVPPGHWAIDPNPVAQYGDGTPTSSWDCPVLNPQDLLDLPRHPDPNRNHGCCRRDGLDGPNLVCPGCASDVATVRDDCWTYLEVRLEPGQVTGKPVSSTLREPADPKHPGPG